MYKRQAQGLHGATYVVEVTFSRRELDQHGVVVDIGAAGDLLREILGGLSYRNLDEHPDLAGRLTTTEVLAEHVADRIVGHPIAAGLARLDVLLREHPDAAAGYTIDLA